MATPPPTPAPEEPALLERQRQLIEELQTLVNHVPYGLMVLEPGGVVRHLNAEAARQLRLPRHLAQGRTLGSLLDFDTMVEQVFLTGEGYTDRERIISTPRFQLHVLDSAVPVKAADGRVLSVVNTFREIQGAHRLAGRLAGSHARHTFDSVLGHSPALRAAVATARKAAQGTANILLSGESGTGKEVFAQAIHNESPRRDGPFIAVNCAALPRDLIESELFGYAPGAFTGAHREGRPGKFEAAQGGTIFLDEVSELPLDVQAKLLRVLQEREVVRLGSTRAVAIDARHHRQQPRPAGPGGAAGVPCRPVLPLPRHRRHAAAAARAAGRHRPAGAALPGALRGGPGQARTRDPARGAGAAAAPPLARQCARA